MEWVAIAAVFPIMIGLYLLYKIFVKVAIAGLLVKVGMNPAWAGLIGLLLGIIVVAVIAQMTKPIWEKFEKWADEDDPQSGSNQMLAEYEAKKNKK